MATGRTIRNLAPDNDRVLYEGKVFCLFPRTCFHLYTRRDGSSVYKDLGQDYVEVWTAV